MQIQIKNLQEIDHFLVTFLHSFEFSHEQFDYAEVYELRQFLNHFKSLFDNWLVLMFMDASFPEQVNMFLAEFAHIWDKSEERRRSRDELRIRVREDCLNNSLFNDPLARWIWFASVLWNLHYFI